MSSAARRREEVSSNAAFLDEGPPRSDYRAVTTPSYRLKAGEANSVVDLVSLPCTFASVACTRGSFKFKPTVEHRMR